MKVLQTIKYYDPCKGGMEAVAKTLVEGAILLDKNISFAVYCNNHLQGIKSHHEKVSERLNIIRQSTPFFIKSQPLNFHYGDLKKLISENEIIHHHYPFPTMEMALLRNITLLKKKKFIITWHANIQNSRWSWIEKIYNPIVDKLLSVADHIVVTSPQLFEQSAILKKHKDKVQVIPLTFDSKFITKEAKTLKKTVNRILFVGKLREYKGLKYLIKAMKGVEAQLDIVGNGEEEKELKKMTEILGLTNKINFHTNVSDENLQLFYRNADLFVLPSINEAEAFGVVQLEALSSGVPVINTQLNSGVPYVSLHKETGVTVPPSNEKALANAIISLLNNPDLYHTYSKNAIQRAKEFSLDKMVSRYLKIYK